MALAPLLCLWLPQNLAAGVHGYRRDYPVTRQLFQGLPRITWRFTLPASAPRGWGSLHLEQSNPSLSVVQKSLLYAATVWLAALEWNHCALTPELYSFFDWLQLFLISQLLDLFCHSDALINGRLSFTDHPTPLRVPITWPSRYDPYQVRGSCTLCRTYVARRGPQRSIQGLFSLCSSNCDILASRAGCSWTSNSQVTYQWKFQRWNKWITWSSSLT